MLTKELEEKLDELVKDLLNGITTPEQADELMTSYWSSFILTLVAGAGHRDQHKMIPSILLRCAQNFSMTMKEIASMHERGDFKRIETELTGNEPSHS